MIGRAFLMLLVASYAVARLDIPEIHERIIVTAPVNPYDSRHWIMEYMPLPISNGSSGGPGGTISSPPPPPPPAGACRQPEIAIKDLKIAPLNSTEEYTSGIFRWGDALKFEIEITNQPDPITVIEYGVTYSLRNSGQYDVYHMSPLFNCRTYIHTLPVAARSLYDENSSTAPANQATGWSVTVTPRLTYRCNSDNNIYTVQGPTGTLSNTFVNQPYYEIDAMDDCPSTGTHSALSYYMLAGNYKLTKPCGITQQVTNTTQNQWQSSYTTSNQFNLSVKAAIEGAGEIGSSVQLVETAVYSLNGQKTSTTTVTLSPDYQYWMGVEKRARRIHLNAWKVSDDIQRWEKKVNYVATGYYDWPWTIVKSCNTGAITATPSNLGNCTSF